jgi:hypothetical protein
VKRPPRASAADSLIELPKSADSLGGRSRAAKEESLQQFPPSLLAKRR